MLLSTKIQEDLAKDLRSFQSKFPSLKHAGNTPIDPSGAGLTYAEEAAFMLGMISKLSKYADQLDMELKDFIITYRKELTDLVKKFNNDIYETMVKRINDMIKTGDFDDTVSRLIYNFDQKVDKNGVGQISLGMLSQEVKEKITGGTLGVVAPKSITSTHILEKSIKESNVTFFDFPQNLFDNTDPDILFKKGYSGDTGVIVDTAIYNISGWIDRFSATKLYFSVDGLEGDAESNVKIAFYRSENEWISTVKYEAGGVKFPNNSTLCRIQYEPKMEVFMQVELDKLTTYSSYNKPKIKTENINYNEIKKKVVMDIFEQRNLLNIDDDTILKNKGFSGNTDNIVDSAPHNISAWISHDDTAKKIIISSENAEVEEDGHFKIAFYKNGSFLKTIFYKKGGIVVPSGTTKYKIQFSNKSKDIQVENNYLTSYKKYTNLPKIKKDYLPVNENGDLDIDGRNFTSYGDSLTFRNMWQPYIIAKTGMIHTNLGIGSTTVALVESVEAEYPSLCNAIRLQSVKDSNPFILTINGGTNDKHRNVAIGGSEEFDKPLSEKDKTCYKGALSYIIEDLLTWKKDLIIVLITPPQADKTKWNYDYGTYAQAMLDVASYYGLGVADWYHKMGVNKININDFTIDGLHQNEKGGKRAANIIFNNIKKNIFI